MDEITRFTQSTNLDDSERSALEEILRAKLLKRFDIRQLNATTKKAIETSRICEGTGMANIEESAKRVIEQFRIFNRSKSNVNRNPSSRHRRKPKAPTLF